MKLYYNREGLNGHLTVVMEFETNEQPFFGDLGMCYEGLIEHVDKCHDDTCSANQLSSFLDALMKGKDPT